MKKILFAAVMAGLLVLAGCSKKEAGDVIKIGVFEPMTGANAAGGAMEVEGIKLANELNPTVVVECKTYKVELDAETGEITKYEMKSSSAKKS